MTRSVSMSAPGFVLALVLAAAMLIVAACTGDNATVEDAAVTPTASPAPTEGDGTPTAEEQYLDVARDRLRGLTESSRHGAEVMAEADVQSDEWRAQARAMLDELRAHHRDAEQLTPPPGLEDVHAALVAATGPFDRAAELLADGIESLDPALLQEAADAIGSGLVAIEEAQLKIREHRQSAP